MVSASPCYDASMATKKSHAVEPKKMNRRSKIIAVVSVVGIILITLFLARGWVRGHLIPQTIGLFERPAISRQSTSDFNEPNEKLKSLGYEFTIGHVLSCPSDSGFNGYASYDNFGISLYCEYQQRSKHITPTEAFRAKWKSDSSAFDKYMNDTGWQQSSMMPIETLFDSRPSVGSYDVTYDRSHGNLYCELDIMYGSDAVSYVEESCSKSITLFGY